MKLQILIITLTIIFICGCKSNVSNDGVYTSPNGNFTCEVRNYELGDIKTVENLLPHGGNVQFIDWLSINRIDYEIAKQPFGHFIQTTQEKQHFLQNYTNRTIIPNISKYASDTKIIKQNFEIVDDVHVYYTSLLLNQIKGPMIQKYCRSMIIHTNGKATYIFTAQSQVENSLGNIEKQMKKQALDLYKSTKIKS